MPAKSPVPLTPIVVRMPPDVRAWLEKRAAKTGATMTAEVLDALRAKMVAGDDASDRAA